jgi:hypothetical protein
LLLGVSIDDNDAWIKRSLIGGGVGVSESITLMPGAAVDGGCSLESWRSLIWKGGSKDVG